MNFEELQAALNGADTLAKSLNAAPVTPSGNTADDKRIAAAAADGEAAGGSDGQTNDQVDANGNPIKPAGDSKPLTKSFAITLDDGTVIEAQDGTEMLKALAGQLGAEKDARVADQDSLLKALGQTIGLFNQLAAGIQTVKDDSAKQIAELRKENATLTKSLTALGNEGRGRRSADVQVIDKPLNGSQQNAAPSRPEILAKAMTALTEQRISGAEAARIEAALNAGQPIEQATLDRIFNK